MPLPKPAADETRDDFIKRCTESEVMNTDFPHHLQRYAVCMRIWENRDKSQEANMEIERKLFTGIELKRDKPGAFTARIATLNVIDKDGDVTLPGAFPEGKTILISAYQHGSWMGELPVGKGVIHEVGNDVLVEGEFNLNSDTGKEHYETVKFAPDLQEWSYGFKVIDSEEDTEFEGNHVWRILKKLDVFEAAPVLRGAGMGTTTLAIKNDKDHGMTLASQTEMALAAIDGVIARVKALGALRREEGKTAMSESTMERMRRLLSQTGQLTHDMQKMMDEIDKPPDDGKAAQAALEQAIFGLLKAQKEINEIMEVIA